LDPSAAYDTLCRRLSGAAIPGTMYADTGGDARFDVRGIWYDVSSGDMSPDGVDEPDP